jgi:hypothetical protein
MITINIPSADWAATGTDEDERGRLTAVIQVNGIPFRFEAFRVVTENEVQVVDTPCAELRTWFVEYSLASSNQHAPFETIEIAGEQYALFGTC